MAKCSSFLNQYCATQRETIMWAHCFSSPENWTAIRIHIFIHLILLVIHEKNGQIYKSQDWFMKSRSLVFQEFIKTVQMILLWLSWGFMKRPFLRGLFLCLNLIHFSGLSLGLCGVHSVSVLWGHDPPVWVALRASQGHGKRPPV